MSGEWAPHHKAPDLDDWDGHWPNMGDTAAGNPANIFRRDLVMKRLGRPPAGSTVLDIGCGQGELALHLQAAFPDTTVWGVDYSLAVIARGRRLIADVERRAPGQSPGSGESLLKAFFGFGFRHSMDDFPLGWQMAALATVPQATEARS